MIVFPSSLLLGTLCQTSYTLCSLPLKHFCGWHCWQHQAMMLVSLSGQSSYCPQHWYLPLLPLPLLVLNSYYSVLSPERKTWISFYPFQKPFSHFCNKIKYKVTLSSKQDIYNHHIDMGSICINLLLLLYCKAMHPDGLLWRHMYMYLTAEVVLLN